MGSDEYSPGFELLNNFSFSLGVLLQTVLVVVHAYKVYSDLFTEERVVLNHCCEKPKRTVEYKRLAYLTLLCIFLFWMYLASVWIMSALTFGSCTKMKAVLIFRSVGFFGGKCTMYLVLVYRLHQTFNSSAYGYNVCKLKCFVAFFIGLGTVLFIGTTTFSFTNSVYHDDTDNEYPYYCNIVFDADLVFLIGAGLAVLDFGATIGTMVMFIRSLNLLIKACEKLEQNYNEAQKKAVCKMVYIGAKYKILVIVSATTTLALLLVFAANLTYIAFPMSALVWVSDPLCLVLMTEYYPSDKYYERLCCVCVACCDRGKNSYRSHASDREVQRPQRTDNIDSTVVQSSVMMSVDTGMAAQTMMAEIVNDSTAVQSQAPSDIVDSKDAPEQSLKENIEN